MVDVVYGWRRRTQSLNSKRLSKDGSRFGDLICRLTPRSLYEGVSLMVRDILQLSKKVSVERV